MSVFLCVLCLCLFCVCEQLGSARSGCVSRQQVIDMHDWGQWRGTEVSVARFEFFSCEEVLGKVLSWSLAGKEARSTAYYVALVLGGVWCARGGAGHPAECQI